MGTLDLLPPIMRTKNSIANIDSHVEVIINSYGFILCEF